MVPRGQIASVVCNGEGHFLLEGRHFINQQRFKLLEMCDISSPVLQPGTRRRIIVAKGGLATVLVDGEGRFLPEGTHLINKARFQLLSQYLPLSSQLIEAILSL